VGVRSRARMSVSDVLERGLPFTAREVRRAREARLTLLNRFHARIIQLRQSDWNERTPATSGGLR
jgi:hypothetical protein